MPKRTVAIGVTAAALLSIAFAPVADAKRQCALIRGSGIGISEGIARWMANKAVTDSAAKWAAGARYTVAPTKLSCSGLSCSGHAKACKQ